MIPLRIRLTGLYSILFGALISLFSYSIYRQFQSIQQTEFDNALHNYAVDLTSGLDFDFFGDLSVDEQVIDEESSRKLLPFSLGKALIQIRDPGGRTVARSAQLGPSSLPLDTSDFNTIERGVESLRTLQRGWSTSPQLGKTSYRILTQVQQRPNWPSHLILQVAAPMTFLEAESKALVQYMLWVVPLMILVSAFVGNYFAGRALAPVSALVKKTESISASNLAARLPIPGSQDEVFQLSQSLNRLLERLEQAFKSQERFVADASHQLKTPLALLLAELDSISREALSAETRSRLDFAKSEALHLSRLTEDLLLLARIDAGLDSMERKVVRLDEILWTQVERLKPLAQQRGVQLRITLDPRLAESNVALSTFGDEELVGALVFNILDNGIKYSPAQHPLEVHLEEVRLGQSRLVIRDHGPGISKEDQARIFERFFRAQHRVHGGSGIGLAVAKQVADLFSIKIELDSQLGRGTEFRITFPAGVENSKSSHFGVADSSSKSEMVTS